jgi:hypothetical protein
MTLEQSFASASRLHAERVQFRYRAGGRRMAAMSWCIAHAVD